MKVAIALTLIFVAMTSALGAQRHFPRMRVDWRARVSVIFALAMAVWLLIAAWWMWVRL